MIEVQPKKIKSAEVTLPGSKSFTHRMMIAAALSNGPCILSHWLKSEDTRHTLEALKRFGIQTETAEADLHIHGQSGYLGPYEQPIYLGNSGTSMRLISALAALGNGIYHLAGNQRMQERPIQDLIDGLKQIGVSAKTLYSNGCPPVTVAGGKLTGGQIELNCEKSSQFLSAILLVAPYTVNGIDIFVTHGPVSRPYIDMTVEVMEKFGIEVKRDAYKRFEVNGKQKYLAGDFDVEPDASQASYFWAAAAITGAEIKVRGLTRHSKQGDIGFVELLERMGCHVSHETNGICVKGGTLSAIDVDMSNMPDVVPTLAVVSAFSNGTTHKKNVGHLK
jgi:3-phosphoshikimate 1-carboxyvinyltransferase